MKSLDQFQKEMMESFYNVTNAAGGLPTDGITDKGGIVDKYQTWNPKELKRINAYIGAILRGQTMTPDSLLTDLRMRLQVIGIDFEPLSIDDQDGNYVVQCSQYRGMGWNAKTGGVDTFENSNEIGLYLVLDYWTNTEGYTQMSGKLVTESEVEEYMDDEDDDLQESNFKKGGLGGLNPLKPTTVMYGDKWAAAFEDKKFGVRWDSYESDGTLYDTEKLALKAAKAMGGIPFGEACKIEEEEDDVCPDCGQEDCECDDTEELDEESRVKYGDMVRSKKLNKAGVVVDTVSNVATVRFVDGKSKDIKMRDLEIIPDDDFNDEYDNA